MPRLVLGAVTLAAALFAALPGAEAAIYTKNSPVLQLDGSDYDRLIAQSNYTTILKLYAPWCGHCQNLKPAYEKAARNLDGLARVAALNCDEEKNKAYCASMGVQGFPTIKTIRPAVAKNGKPAGKPVVEDYQGQRTASAIVDWIVARINNHVQKVDDKTVDDFLSANNDTAKAILFTEKGTTSALLKSLAIDFLDVITVAQARNREKKTVAMFGVDTFPTLILLPGGHAEALVYDGELKKDAMLKFLSKAGAPNPDPAPVAPKPKSKDKAKPMEQKPMADGAEHASTATQKVPVIVETALPIPTIHSFPKLAKECFGPKAHTCVLAFVNIKRDTDAGSKTSEALTSLSELAFKHAQAKRHLFPFFAVSRDAGAKVLEALELGGADAAGGGDDAVEIVAVTARRGWWRRYEGESLGHEGVETWIDTIRMGEGAKKELPEALVAAAAAAVLGQESEGDASTNSASADGADAPSSSAAQEADSPTAEPETGAAEEVEQKPVIPPHEEL